jgi:hypothetical protein
VNYQVRIAETPISGIPVMVNAESQVTDDNGSIAVSMDAGKYYAISSGLSAVTFDSLYDSGANFISRGDKVIEATRLVSVGGPACRILVGSVPSIYFTTVNQTDMTHTVSRIYKANRMYSVTGGATPPDYFAPGTSGFAVPEVEFTQNGALTGVWSFLGQSVNVSSDLNMCADTGAPAQCSVVTKAELRAPVDYARAVVIRFTKLATSLAKKGLLKKSQGSYAATLLGRGASILAAMQKALAPAMTGTAYVCDAQPASSCKALSLKSFKTTAQRNFARLFAKPIPRGFESIAKAGPQEGRLFKSNSLDKLPDEVWICPAGVTPAAQ